jgi:hypothetical protein
MQGKSKSFDAITMLLRSVDFEQCDPIVAILASNNGCITACP